MKPVLREEDGIALVMALAITVVLVIFVTSMISYTSQNSRNVEYEQLASRSARARRVGHRFGRVDSQSGGERHLSDDCSAARQAASTARFRAPTSRSPASGGTTYVHGLYTQVGNHRQPGRSPPTARSRTPPVPQISTKTMTATVAITGGGQSNNISVWNYVYSTAPPGAGCEVDISGNERHRRRSRLRHGDLCISGTTSKIIENTANGGQPVDVRVGGKALVSGNNAPSARAAHQHHERPCRRSAAATIRPPHTCTTADKWYVGGDRRAAHRDAADAGLSRLVREREPGPEQRSAAPERPRRSDLTARRDASTTTRR